MLRALTTVHSTFSKLLEQSSHLRLYFAMTLDYLARLLSGRSRRNRRLLKVLVILLSCCSFSYLAGVSFKKNNVILTCECGGNFTDEVQKPSNTREIQPTVKDYSSGNDSEKVQKSTAPFKNLPLSFKKIDVIFASESGGNLTGAVQKPTAPPEEERKGRLTVSIWRDLCGGEVKVLRNSPLYPNYPNEKIIYDITEFQIEDNQAGYGQAIAGFLNPVRSGSYRFAIASDDSSELWLSPSENPDEKQLIASVFVEGAAGWTRKNEVSKFEGYKASHRKSILHRSHS